MKLKPVIKTSNSKSYLVPWVIERFPENYREMTYLEPFLGGGDVMLNKDRSAEEVVNDPDYGMACAWRALRDEPKTLLTKLRKTDHTERTFNRHKGRERGEDYIQDAVSEFVLRHMSRGGHKKAYFAREKSKGHFLENAFQRFKQVHERLEDVYVLNKDVISLLRAFNDSSTLVYCDPPPLEEVGEGLHVELGDVLKNFKGKVVVTARNSALYKRIYSEWCRKGVPGHPKESAWFNF